MQRREALAAMAGAGTIAVAGCLGGDNGDTDDIHLEVGSFLTDEDVATARAFIPPFFEKLEEKLGEEVTYDFLGSGSVGGQGEMFELAADGILDLAIETPAAYGSQAELSTFLNIPGIFGTSREAHGAACGALYELVAPNGESGLLYEEDYEQFDVRPLMAGSPGPYNLNTTFRVEEMADLDGAIARASSGMNQRIAETLGMGTQEVTGGDIDTAFQQGIVDADIQAAHSLWSNNWYEYLSHETTNLNLGGFNMNWVMGNTTFDGYADEVQEALIEAGREVSHEYAEVYWNILDEEMYGSDIITMDENEFEDPQGQVLHYETPAADDIHEIVDPLADEWIQERDDDGMPASEVVEEFQSNL